MKINIQIVLNVQKTKLVVLLMLLTLLPNCSQSLTINNPRIKRANIGKTPNENQKSLMVRINQKIYTRIGKEVKLVCSADYDKEYCSFTSPTAKEYTMNNEYASQVQHQHVKMALDNEYLLHTLLVLAQFFELPYKIFGLIGPLRGWQ